MKRTVITTDMMRPELLPTFSGEAQQRIADVSQMIFDIMRNKMRDKAAEMLKMAAERMKIYGLSEFRNSIGQISLARMIDRAAAADKEAEEISGELKGLSVGLYKENMLLDTFSQMLTDSVYELEEAGAALNEHIKMLEAQREDIRYIQLARKKQHDMTLSQTLAINSQALINEMTAANNALSERINSLQMVTMVLWRSDLSALKSAPDDSRLDSICGIEDSIAAAIVNILS